MRQEMIVYTDPVQAWWWDHPEWELAWMGAMAVAIVLIPLGWKIKCWLDDRRNRNNNRRIFW